MSLLLAPIYAQGAPPPGNVTFGDDSVDGYLAAFWTISYNGNIYKQTAPSTRAVWASSWISPQVGMELYECRATQLDLARPKGTYGTWLDLGTTAWTWGLSPNAGGGRVAAGTVYPDQEGSFLLEIRRKSDLVVVASGTVTVFMGGNA